MMLPRKFLPEIITIGIVVIGALCFPLISNGLQYFPPLLFAALRVAIAGISILCILPLLHQPRIPPKGTWRWVILFSILAVAFTYGTMFLSHGGMGLSAVPVLENLQPFLAVVLAVIFLHEKLSSATRFVLVFGIVGILLMSASVFMSGAMFDFQRAMLAVLASLSAAVSSILAKGIKRPDAIITISAWQFIIGSIPLLILWQLFEKNTPLQVNGSFVGALLFLAIIGTATTSAVWYALVQKVDVSRLSVLFFLAPAIATALSNRLYGVSVSGFELAGITIIVLGVVRGFKKTESA